MNRYLTTTSRRRLLDIENEETEMSRVAKRILMRPTSMRKRQTPKKKTMNLMTKMKKTMKRKLKSLMTTLKSKSWSTAKRIGHLSKSLKRLFGVEKSLTRKSQARCSTAQTG